MKVALLCSGAGAASIIGAAYLDGVLDMGIKPFRVYGTSGGAINSGVGFSSGIDALRTLWMSVKNKDIYRSSPLTWFGAFSKPASIYDSRPLRKLLGEYVSPLKGKEGPIVSVAVSDVDNERALYVNLSTLSECPSDWVFASGSPPVFFPPVEIHGRKYLDGGLGENLGISSAIREGADLIIILWPRGKSKGTELENILDAVKFTIRMPLTYMLEKELKFVEAMNDVPGKRHVDVIVIRPPNTNQVGILDFDDLGPYDDRRKLWLDAKGHAQRTIQNEFARLGINIP